MEIITETPRTWADILSDLPKDETRRFPLAHKNSIRSALATLTSSKGRAFKTYSTDTHFHVHRTA